MVLKPRMKVIVVLHPGLEMVIVTRPTIMRGVNGMEMIVVMVVLMITVIFVNVLIPIINL